MGLAPCGVGAGGSGKACTQADDIENQKSKDDEAKYRRERGDELSAQFWAEAGLDAPGSWLAEFSHNRTETSVNIVGEGAPPDDLPPSTEGSVWIVKNVDALEQKALPETWDGHRNPEDNKRWCATLPQLWNESQGGAKYHTARWIMGDLVRPGLNIQRGAVLATFNRRTGKYESNPSGNHVVVFLKWVTRIHQTVVFTGMPGGGVMPKIHSYAVTYMRVVEQGPSFKPRIREIPYSDSILSGGYFNNAWYYNMVRVK